MSALPPVADIRRRIHADIRLPVYARSDGLLELSTQYIVSAGAITLHHYGSKPLAVKVCLTAGEVRNAISAFAASVCVLPELIPATYKE
jgi:hypothetical protein